MKFCAWFELIGSGLLLILGPLTFGKSRQPYTYETWLYQLIELAIIVPLCGRVLGWW